MYNNGNDRINSADEIMRRLMEITGRGITDEIYNYDMNNGLRSIHGVPEGNGQGDMQDMPTISQQRPPQRPSNGNNMNGSQQSPQRPQNPPVTENRPPKPQPPCPQPPKPQPSKPNKPSCGMRPGYAYVMPHGFEDIYEPSKALKRGTMFKDLDLPKNVYEMKGEE